MSLLRMSQYSTPGHRDPSSALNSFTVQLTALYLFALYLAQLRETIMPEQAKAAVQELTRIPGKLEHLLTGEEECEDLAKEYVRAQDFLFLGRGIHYPIALEGALKLKEVSYIHAEGYPAGEKC
jgi:glutamine---fructose-6-phosphate transaminase (isomerizing)